MDVCCTGICTEMDIHTCMNLDYWTRPMVFFYVKLSSVLNFIHRINDLNTCILFTLKTQPVLTTTVVRKSCTSQLGPWASWLTRQVCKTSCYWIITIQWVELQDIVMPLSFSITIGRKYSKSIHLRQHCTSVHIVWRAWYKSRNNWRVGWLADWIGLTSF